MALNSSSSSSLYQQGMSHTDTKQEAAWAPELVWTLRRVEKLLAPGQNTATVNLAVQKYKNTFVKLKTLSYVKV
jgi:hypothetical protein